ncbi:MAG: DMT family transporter [Reyranellaceae bacterium]
MSAPKSAPLPASQPDSARRTPPLLAYALLPATALMFSANMLVARATAHELPPASLAFWRWAGALLLMLAFSAGPLWRHRAAALREWPDMLFLGGLGMGICGAAVYLGAATTSATNIGLIYAASPVLIILFARLFYGETMGGRQMLGVGLCLAGVLAVIGRGQVETFLGLRFTIGDLLILAAAIGWAVYSVVLKHRPSALPPTARLAAITIGGLLSLLPFVLLEPAIGRPYPLSWHGVGVAAFLALVPGFGAYQAYGYVQRHLGAGPTGLIMYLSPLSTGLLAFLLLGEDLHLYHLAGAALVLPGIFLATGAGLPK